MNDLGFNKYLSIAEQVMVMGSGYYGWERAPINKSLHTVVCLRIMGKGRRNIEIVSIFDDIAKGSFFYEDILDKPHPIMLEGEPYTSIYTFKLKEDCIKFEELYKDEIHVGN